jgi:alkyl hydroperoxide reductase subunit AhpC
VATLLLAAGASGDCPGTTQNLTSPSLRAWLRDSWAILFSHPDDFVRYDLEMDRWLVITRRAFAERGIRPLALASQTLDPQHNWVTHVSGDNRSVLLEDLAQQHFGPVDLQTPVLREAIEQTGRRFAMIIDSALRIQRTFTYQALSNLPSPLELLGWAEALRAKGTARPARCLHSRARPRRSVTRAQPWPMAYDPRPTRKVPARDLIGTRCKTAAAPATVTGE